MKYLPIITKEEWDLMSNKDKRIAIAKDVLARIEVKNIKPQCGTYINFEMINEAVSAKELFNAQSCTACARGAMFMSFIGVNNELQLNNGTDTISFVSSESYCSEINNLEQKETETIVKLFGEEQIALIETAFESTPSGNFEDYWYENDISIGEEVEQYRDDYDTTEEVLIAIMQNIIDNNGTFEI